ncbi:MAG TPA: HD domain-containing protein [Thermotogota bacterium]|nr:HD domain-containing protein [Thermotogota bacterium]HPJ89270.1 HD domain-containing protein [Thermotogota bacterium]HPR96438.1 HD domain-containing protein [Thermotogota bacterium]
MKYRVSRDPVYGEILLSPLEILCIDSKPIQRLREISQLGGAERVYPGATHTRFLHSLGVMHLSGMYAQHLNFDRGKSRLLRLAGLLHDIGHGPYSHQFDEVAYAKAGLKDGHDEQRERLLLELMPVEMIKVYDEVMKEEWRQNVIEDVRDIIGDEVVELSLQEAFFTVMKRVCEIFDGESAGTADFNIVQGPLGADRIDFVLRDAHYCGTPEYGTLDLQRIVRSSKIIEKNGVKRLTYNEKIMDSIYRVLFGRFMMYKNVYFHKTARAADLMIQRVLELAYDFLHIGDYIEDVHRFCELTEGWLYFSIRERYAHLSEYDGKEAAAIQEAFEIMQNYKERRLWKSIVELSFSITGMDPTRVAMSVGEERIESIIADIGKVLKKGDIPEVDREELEAICENPVVYFKIDTPYKLTLAHPAEFLVNEVYLRTGRTDSELVDFETFLKNSAFYQSVSGQLVQIVRIYIMSDIRDLLNKYALLDFKDGLELTTRW